VNYEELAAQARLFRPKLIIAGGSAYPRDWDYTKYRAVCDENNSLLLVDMSHFSGLVAAKEHANPFELADIVTSTTHKTLRGPRSGIIFFKKELEEKINSAVFPSLQGGPHMHQIAAVATQLREVNTPEFHDYIKQVKRNAKALAEALMQHGYKLSSGGTDNHLMLLDLRPQQLTGSKAEKLFDRAHITVNKNSIIGDKSAVTPGGLRLGTPALTTRGLVESDFKQIAEFLHRGIQIGCKLQTSGQKLVDFVKAVKESEDVKALGEDVVAFSKVFPFPGLEEPFPVK